MIEVGGIAPHIGKREGYTPPPSTTLAALPAPYLRSLAEGTRKQQERWESRRSRRRA